jgi:hypothetical protein
VFSRFTASARRVVQRAFREAKRQQNDFVGTEHLLYGLLCDADGPAVHLLRLLNVGPEVMLDKVELSLQRHDAARAMEQFPLSPASRRVFHSAFDEATALGHQLIGPEHLLLGIMGQAECEAAQILTGQGMSLGPLRAAVVHLPPDSFQESKIQQNPPPRFTIGDNPSAAELENWIEPPLTHADVSPADGPEWPGVAVASSPQDAEAQLRRTQYLLGGLLGFTFGYWLWGWPMGVLLAVTGMGVAGLRSSWVGITIGAGCGLFFTALFRGDHILAPVAMGLLGGFLGSFLGDAWGFRSVRPEEPPSERDPESSNRD